MRNALGAGPLRAAWRWVRVLIPALALVTGGALATTTGALAYGVQDQPLAQVEISATCENPGLSLCQAPPAGFGLGGIWVWVEVDGDGTADIRGAVCTRGAGAQSLHFTGTWTPFNGTAQQLYAQFGGPPAMFVAGTDPNNRYYVLRELGLAVPATQGHYSTRFGPAAAVQVQIAP